MPAFSFRPELTTITATFTPHPDGRPVPSVFVFPTAISGGIRLPFGIAVSGSIDFFDDGCDDGSAGQGGHQFDAPQHDPQPPTHNPPDSAKEGKPTCSTEASRSAAPAPTPPQTATPTPSIRPSPISTQTQTSETVTTSGSASADASTPTGRRPSQSTESSDMQSTTGSPSTTSTIAGSFPSPSLSPSFGGPSDSTTPLGTPSTPPAPLPPPPPPTQPSLATPGLSAGAAVGIALGVFVAAGVLVAAAIFLFLRRRSRSRVSRKRHSDSSMRRQLRTSEDSPRRSLSSTWSWFGSVPIGSELDPGYRRYGESPRPHPRDDPFHGPDPEKDASVTSINPLAWCTPPSAPPPRTSMQLGGPISLHVPAEHCSPSGLTPPPWARNPPKVGREEGAVQLLLALAEKALSASTQPINATLTPSREARDDSEGSWDVGNVRRDGVDVQRAHDPFADPRTSTRISEGSTAVSASDVVSVEAL